MVLTSDSDTQLHAERLGPYRLLDLLGEGGMSEVWLAEQLEPVRRQVAVKFIKLGMDTREVLARFDAERQLLALMDHPNIASVYDGGATSTGRPYFAMELVRGIPITDYCDSRRLATRERLTLFASVCRAVQHAHQKGIIHRDLKPSNVLVAETSSGPVPKIIDFGIAKAVGGQWLTDKTLQTRLGQTLGTPAYMSPEQAETWGVDIDTRTDIYSLGVMLYELLVGTLPFTPQPGAPLEYAIRNYEVKRPSARLLTLSTKEIVATFRRTTSHELRRQLRGDLDWIILRAIEKDRTRRYETANGLAVDIERSLSHKPVSARPPTFTYRLQKFVRRHRAASVAAAVGFIGLAVGAVMAATGLIRARTSEALARREAATAREVSSFLVDLFAINDPSEARGNAVTAREILDRGAARVRTDLRTEPQVRARLLSSIGNVYASLGLFPQAESLLRDALASEQRPDGGGLAVPAALRDLAGVLQGQGQIAEADSLLRLAIGLQQSVEGPTPDTLMASLLVALAGVQTRYGHTAAADSLLRSALAVQEAARPRDSLMLARTLAQLAFLHDDDPATFEPMLRRAYDIERAARGPDHPRTLGVAYNLAVMLDGMGRFAEAERLFEQVAVERERVLGERHPQVGMSLLSLAMVQLERRRPADALSTLERATRLLLVSDSSRTAVALRHFARAHLQLGAPGVAEGPLLRSVVLLERTAGPAHNWTALARATLGELYLRSGRLVDAEAALRRAIRDQERNWGPTHRRLVEPLAILGEVYATQLRFAEADSVYRRAIRASDLGLVADHPLRAEVRREYVAFLRAAGRAVTADSVERGVPATRRR